MICPHCHYVIPPERQHCPCKDHCGRFLPFCPRCGHPWLHQKPNISIRDWKEQHRLRIFYPD